MLWFCPYQFYYPGASVVQMRFLRLHSVAAIQKITYSCQQGRSLGQTDREVKFLTDAWKQSYHGVLKDCVVCRPKSFISFFCGNRCLSDSNFLFNFIWKIWMNYITAPKCMNSKSCVCVLPACRGDRFWSSGVWVWVRRPPAAPAERCSSYGRWKLHASVWLQGRPCVFQLEDAVMSGTPTSNHVSREENWNSFCNFWGGLLMFLVLWNLISEVMWLHIPEWKNTTIPRLS